MPITNPCPGNFPMYVQCSIQPLMSNWVRCSSANVRSDVTQKPTRRMYQLIGWIWPSTQLRGEIMLRSLLWYIFCGMTVYTRLAQRFPEVTSYFHLTLGQFNSVKWETNGLSNSIPLKRAMHVWQCYLGPRTTFGWSYSKCSIVQAHWKKFHEYKIQISPNEPMIWPIKGE